MLVFKTGSKAECEAAAVIMSELLKTQVITPEQLDEEDALFEYANASCVFLKDQPPRPVTDARIQIQSREDVLADPSVIAHHGAADLEEDDGGSVAAVLRDSSQKVGGIFFPHYNDETSFEPGEQAYLAGFVDAGPSSYYIIVSEDLSHFENWTAV